MGMIHAWCGCTLPDPHLSYRPEAAIALRQRLNETVSELDELKKDHTELEVQNNTLSKELTIVKSDRPS